MPMLSLVHHVVHGGVSRLAAPVLRKSDSVRSLQVGTFQRSRLVIVDN